MKRSTLFRFFLIGFAISLGLGFASLYALRILNESSISEVRKHMIMFIVQIVEGAPYAESVQDHHFRAGKRSSGSDLWVVSEKGDILAKNTTAPLPISWDGVKRPIGVHEFAFHYRLFKLVSDLTLVKLDTKENTYLLIGSRRQASSVNSLWVQVSFLFFVMGLAILIASIFISGYLRKKSLEARLILSRLEKGDLEARFDIKRLDEIGSLMLDFNRMAAEIERLVHRIQETERARKNLLEELSHDIRTPLTSLKTSIETLSEHLDQMPKEEQREFLNVSQAELAYFLRLVDDLFFVADLGEPRYKKTTQKLDLAEMISSEIKNRQSHQKKIHWEINFEKLPPEIHGKPLVLGDPLLIQRLIKNSFDNAAKYAQTQVRISIQTTDHFILLVVEDDGEGISEGAIVDFGRRRKQRVQPTNDNHSISLGLGSVIMKTIVELHGGDLKIENRSNAHGTRLTLKLKNIN